MTAGSWTLRTSPVGPWATATGAAGRRVKTASRHRRTEPRADGRVNFKNLDFTFIRGVNEQTQQANRNLNPRPFVRSGLSAGSGFLPVNVAGRGSFVPDSLATFKL